MQKNETYHFSFVMNPTALVSPYFTRYARVGITLRTVEAHGFVLVGNVFTNGRQQVTDIRIAYC